MAEVIQKQRAFLKWAGGKYQLAPAIRSYLPEADLLIEPFVGAASVFLNTDYKRYLLNDINADLIHLYQIIQSKSDDYICAARELFHPKYNNKEMFLDIREQFNQSEDIFERAIYFLYLNRHCFNGLCRYNKSGLFNVPFGKYKQLYFPEKELHVFAEKSQRAIFICQNYRDVIANSQSNSVIYCDPPYVPISKTANFTSYAKNSFTLDDQADLASLAEAAQARGCVVLISNHDTSLTRRLYCNAELHCIQVSRLISQNGATRNKVDELFALYR